MAVACVDRLAPCHCPALKNREREAQTRPGAGWWSDALQFISADGRPSTLVPRVELKAAARRVAETVRASR